MNDWIETKLEELADISSGGTPSRAIDSYWNGDIPWVTPSDITKYKTNYLNDTQDSITHNGLSSSSAKLLPAGTLLFTSRATIGEVKISAKPVSTNQGFKNLIPKGSIDGDFLFYQIRNLKSEFVKYAAGSTFLEINRKDTGRVLIPHPSQKDEQKKIGAILKTIDQTIEKTEALIEKYRQIKAGLMHDLFTRGIGTDGKLRPPREQAPELYQATPIGWIPKEWRIKKISDLAAQFKGSTVIDPFGSDLVMSDYRSEGTPVVFVRDVKEDNFSWVSDVFISGQKTRKLFAHRVNGGDLLATKMSLPPCVSCVYPDDMPMGVITADMIRMTVDNSKVDSYWLSSAINHDRIKRQVAAITAGVTRPKVTLADFRSLKVATPSLEEQLVANSILDRTRKLITSEKDRLIKLQKQKSGLMHDLLTGKVQVKIREAEAADA